MYPRLSTDAFITTLMRDRKGKDLSGFVLRDILSIPIAEVAKCFKWEVDKLKRGGGS